MKVGLLALLLSLPLAAMEPPVSLWGTWMGPCGAAPEAEYYRRIYYTFDSEMSCFEHQYYFTDSKCSGQPQPAPPRSGTYSIGSGQTTPQGDKLYPIDLIYGPNESDGGTENFYQIYSISKDNLMFGKSWPNSSSARPTELERSKVWQKVSPY